MKIGLVLEGGAHRTVFSCGVMDALLESNIMADYVIGSSAGITYGTSYVSKQTGRNREMLRRFVRDKRYAGTFHLLRRSNRAYYNLSFLFDKIPNELLPFDYAAYEAYEGEVLAAVTNIRTGQAEYLPVTHTDLTWKALQATCALPMLFQPVEINGELYADGGIADSIPFEKAMADGCDKLIIVLTRERSYRKEAEKLMDLIAKRQSKKHPEYAQAMLQRHIQYNACIERLSELEEQGRAFVIVPEDTLGVSRTDKHVDKLMELYAQGYRIAAHRMTALKQYLQEEPEIQEERQTENGGTEI